MLLPLIRGTFGCAVSPMLARRVSAAQLRGSQSGDTSRVVRGGLPRMPRRKPCRTFPTCEVGVEDYQHSNLCRMLHKNVGNWRTQLKSISMWSCALLTCAVLGMSGCNKAQSPDKIRHDIAAAQNEAAQDKAKAEEKRKSEERQASADLAKAKADAQSKAADRSVAAVADAAVTEAEADTTVALAKCESLEGDAQQKCKDAANTHLASVKKRAKAAEAQ